MSVVLLVAAAVVVLILLAVLVATWMTVERRVPPDIKEIVSQRDAAKSDFYADPSKFGPGAKGDRGEVEVSDDDPAPKRPR